MDTRRKLLFRAMSRTLQAAAVVVVGVVIIRHIRTVTRRRSPRVTAVAEVEEDSPIFPAFQVNSPASSVVLGTEKERVLKMDFPNLAPMPRHMHPRSRHTGADRIGPFHRGPFRSNLRRMRRPTRHPTRRASLSHLKKAINLLTINLCDSSGIAAEPEDTVTGVVLGTAGLRSQNRKTMKRARIRGRMIGSLDTLRTTALEVQLSPKLSKGSDSKTCTRFHDEGMMN